MPEKFTYQRADLFQPNAEVRIHVKAGDLPVVCPPPETYLWSSHPKVFLPVHESGEETCPYCGTVFVLDEDDELAIGISGMREWK